MECPTQTASLDEFQTAPREEQPIFCDEDRRHVSVREARGAGHDLDLELNHG